MSGLNAARIETVLSCHVVTSWAQHQWICRACFTPEEPFVEWPERHHAELVMQLIAESTDEELGIESKRAGGEGRIVRIAEGHPEDPQFRRRVFGWERL